MKEKLCFPDLRQFCRNNIYGDRGLLYRLFIRARLYGEDAVIARCAAQRGIIRSVTRNIIKIFRSPRVE